MCLKSNFGICLIADVCCFVRSHYLEGRKAGYIVKNIRRLWDGVLGLLNEKLDGDVNVIRLFK